jgi:apolipoprotein N-acyltransferase
LFWAGWPSFPFFPLLFLGFVPLLYLEQEVFVGNIFGKYLRLFPYAWLAFFIWNVATTWWVWNSTALGSVLAFLCNALLMCIPFMLFHHVKKKFGKGIGYISLIVFWLTFEYLHMRWDLSWPWLTLGNGLSRFPYFIQWYEYTGHLGGSLWILILSILFFEAINPVLHKETKFSLKSPASITAITIFILPILISLFIYSNYKETGVKKNVVVVQPNIDPYNEKFDNSTLDLQMNKLLSLSAEDVDSTTDYLVWPETAIPEAVLLDNVEANPYIIQIRTFLKKYPNLKLVTGISAYHTFSTKETSTTFKNDDGKWIEAYNAAIQLDSTKKVPVYYKSILVPFVESVPYPKVFAFFEPLLINEGGTSVSYGRQDTRSVFFSKDKTGIAPVICYESIFGEYVSDYVKDGANLIFIMTNDGWWGNTDGHLQHLYYGAMRAIESRRCIARSANTGTSCFIDEEGNIIQATPWWQSAVIKAALPINSKETFYTRHGDYIGFYSLLISAVLILLAVIKFLLERV